MILFVTITITINIIQMNSFFSTHRLRHYFSIVFVSIFQHTGILKLKLYSFCNSFSYKKNEIITTAAIVIIRVRTFYISTAVALAFSNQSEHPTTDFFFFHTHSIVATINNSLFSSSII